VEIDFTADTQYVYYNEAFLTNKSWTDGVSGDGPLELGGIDLFANGATPIYYDDLSITGESVPPQPVLSVESIAGGFGVSAVIKNTGEAAATNVDWTITLDGGLIILGGETTDTVLTIPAGGQAEIASGLILGFGKTTILVTATCDEGATDEESASGFVFLFFVLGVE